MNILRKYPAIYLSIVVLMAGGVFAFLFILSRGESVFPKISVGVYSGEIVGVFGEETEPTPILLEVESDYLSVFILRPGWGKIFIADANNRLGAPLEFSAAEAHLRLSGSKDVSGESYSGTVYNLDEGRRGQWSLRSYVKTAVALSAVDIKGIKSTVTLNKELSSVIDEKLSIQQSLIKNKEAVAKLNEFLADSEVMNERADSKFEQVQRDYDSAMVRLKEKRKEARELAQRLVLSESVTSAGSLVVLSRKTIERENRWLDSIFESSGGGSSFNLDQEVARAERILELKRKIGELKAE
jgi:hypothetical protein